MALQIDLLPASDGNRGEEILQGWDYVMVNSQRGKAQVS